MCPGFSRIDSRCNEQLPASTPRQAVWPVQHRRESGAVLRSRKLFNNLRTVHLVLCQWRRGNRWIWNFLAGPPLCVLCLRCCIGLACGDRVAHADLRDLRGAGVRGSRVIHRPRAMSVVTCKCRAVTCDTSPPLSRLRIAMARRRMTYKYCGVGIFDCSPPIFPASWVVSKHGKSQIIARLFQIWGIFDPSVYWMRCRDLLSPSILSFSNPQRELVSLLLSVQ